MKNLLRFLSIATALSLAAFAFAGDDKKTEACKDCKDRSECCKDSKESSCCKKDEKKPEKKPDGR